MEPSNSSKNQDEEAWLKLGLQNLTRKLYSSFAQERVSLRFKDHTLETEFRQFFHKSAVWFFYYYTFLVQIISVLATTITAYNLATSGNNVSLILSIAITIGIGLIYILWYFMVKRFTTFAIYYPHFLIFLSLASIVELTFP